jgi:hypothetical protein
MVRKRIGLPNQPGQFGKRIAGCLIAGAPPAALA